MTKQEIRNVYGERFTVSIGDTVGWKDGIEDCGEVLEINSYWLVVKTDDGKILEICSEVCWAQ